MKTTTLMIPCCFTSSNHILVIVLMSEWHHLVFCLDFVFSFWFSMSYLFTLSLFFHLVSAFCLSSVFSLVFSVVLVTLRPLVTGRRAWVSSRYFYSRRLLCSILTSADSSQSCHVVSLSLLSVNSGKSLELRLPLIPSQENQQAERKRGWEQRKREAEKTKESERSRRTDRQTTLRGRGEEKRWPYPCVYLHFLLLNHELAVLLCAPALTRR